MSIKQPITDITLKTFSAIAALATLLAGLALANAAPAVADDAPINVAAAKSNDNPPEVTTSYDGATWSPKSGLNDADTSTANYGGWGTWGNTSSQETATYTWSAAVTTGISKAWFYTNVPPAVSDGDSGILLPKSVSLQYLSDDGEFKDVTNLKVDQDIPQTLENGKAVYGPFTYTYDSVTTKALRLVVQKQANDNKGITVNEWEVWGTHGETPVDPGDPDEFLTTQEVWVRTTPGVDPTNTLPGKVWGIPENGPLRYTTVSWDAIPSSDYATAGTTSEVKGTTAEGVSVSATVQVVDSLSTEITGAEFVSTITTPGTAPVLPDTVYLEYADGSKQSGAKVNWPDIPAEQYATAEQDGFVTGTITDPATTVEAQGSFIVVEASSDDAPPIADVEFTEAASGNGWYTTTPVFSVRGERGVSTVPITTLEYRLNGGDWITYTNPVPLTQQGSVTVEGRVTDSSGKTATQKQVIKVDTEAPVTSATATGEGKSKVVTVTLNTQADTSGVTRTLWSSGPSNNPKSNSNTMWGTYEKPFAVSLEHPNTPYYVHFYSQDAAGNTESYKMITLTWDGTTDTVKVESVSIGGDDVQNGKLGLVKGGQTQLKATIKPDDATDKTVTWATSDDTVAAIDADGKLTALKPGTATITATANDGTGISDTLEVTVTDKQPAPVDPDDPRPDNPKDKHPQSNHDQAKNHRSNEKTLSQTGSDLAWIVAATLLLSAAGIGLLIMIRHRPV